MCGTHHVVDAHPETVVVVGDAGTVASVGVAVYELAGDGVAHV